MSVNTRVLVINHPESDYGAAMLWNGLCEVLGPENVYDYPAKLSYHGQVHEGYILPDGKRGLTAPLHWVPAWPSAWGDKDPLEAAPRLLGEGHFGLF